MKLALAMTPASPKRRRSTQGNTLEALSPTNRWRSHQADLFVRITETSDRPDLEAALAEVRAI